MLPKFWFWFLKKNKNEQIRRGTTKKGAQKAEDGSDNAHTNAAITIGNKETQQAVKEALQHIATGTDSNKSNALQALVEGTVKETKR